MAKTHNKTGKLGLTFGVMMRPTGTTPLDDRLIVDSISDLTNGTITAPYRGMVVNIAGTGELWVLKTQGIAESKISSNWERIGGSDSINNLVYATEDDVNGITDGDSDSDYNENALVQIKTLNYFRQKLQEKIQEIKEEVETIKEDYATKEYVDEKTSWSTSLPE